MPAFWHGDNLNVGGYLNPYCNSLFTCEGSGPKDGWYASHHPTTPVVSCCSCSYTHAKTVLLLTKETVVVKHALAMQLTTYLDVQYVGPFLSEIPASKLSYFFE